MTAQLLQDPRDTNAQTGEITASVVPALDIAIAEMVRRELVSGTEVVNLLLDLRLIAAADAAVGA